MLGFVDGIAVTKNSSSVGTGIEFITDVGNFRIHIRIVDKSDLIGFAKNVFDFIVLVGGKVDDGVTF